jgi:hypothetical protein
LYLAPGTLLGFFRKTEELRISSSFLPAILVWIVFQGCKLPKLIFQHVGYYLRTTVSHFESCATICFAAHFAVMIPAVLPAHSFPYQSESLIETIYF